MFNILLNNSLSRKIVSTAVSKTIEKKLGRKLEMDISELDIHDEKDDSVKIKVEAEATLKKEDLKEIMGFWGILI